MSFAHEFPKTDDEWEYTCPFCSVRVSKVGGGTLGRAYTGHWHYRIVINGTVHQGSDLHTGTPKTHAEAATQVADFFGPDDALSWCIEQISKLDTTTPCSESADQGEPQC